MKRRKKSARALGLAALGALAAGVTLVCAGTREGAHPAARVAGPEDLRTVLWLAHSEAPPGGELSWDSGDFLFVPDGTDPDAELFAAGLLPWSCGGRETVWPVTLFEECETRDTVFLNAAGDEVLRIPPPPGYRSSWVVDNLYPEGSAPEDVASAYDPARVTMSARLHFSGEVRGADDLMRGGESVCGADQAGRTLPLASSATGPVFGLALSQGDAPPHTAPLGRGERVSIRQRGVQIWHVNSDTGDDANDGLASVARSGRRGPKASVQQAIDVAETGDVIEIRGRAPFSDSSLWPKEKQIRLIPAGCVRF